MHSRIRSDEKSNAGLARLVLVCVVAVATLVVAMRTGREEALVVVGKQETGTESRLAVEGIGERNGNDEPKGSLDKEACAKRVFDEWKLINKDAKSAKLSWMKTSGSVLKDATVYDVDGSGQKRAVLMKDFDGLGGRRFGRGQYRVQTASRNGKQFLMVWSDNTVARVESAGCRVTGVYLGTKNGGLDGRIVGDVGVKGDDCGRTAICTRDGFSGTCNGQHDCPNHFTLVRHNTCSYNGICLHCTCGFQICNCPGCVSTNCPTHFDTNCPPRGGSTPCAAVNPLVASSASKEGEAVQFFAGFVSAASAILPPHFAAPAAIVAWVVGEDAQSNALDRRFNDLTGAMERAITNLHTCMKVEVAAVVAGRATGYLGTVRDKMIPESLRGQSAADRERDDHWDAAKTACDNLGILYRDEMATSDWNKAASLLPTTVEAAELCALLFASMASDLVALHDTSDTTFRNLKADFKRMMTRTLDASKRWISTMETALLTNALCGRFPDLRALVPVAVEGYKRDFFSPVGAVGGPLILTLSEGYLFQCESSVATYLYMDGVKRWIPNERTLLNLIGGGFHKITRFPDYVCSNVPEGAPLTDGATTILCDGYPHAMLRSNGEKRWICSGSLFNKFKFDWGKLVRLSVSQCTNICTGKTICDSDLYRTSASFTQLTTHLGPQCSVPPVLRCSSSPKAYLYIHYEKRWMPTWETYVRLLGGDTRKMVVLSDAQCAKIPTGVTMTAGARLIQCSGYGHVFLESNGKKYWLCSLSTIHKYKFVLNPVHISVAQCKALCTAPTICDGVINSFYWKQLNTALTSTTCT